jgi:hypothetical protein
MLCFVIGSYFNSTKLIDIWERVVGEFRANHVNNENYVANQLINDRDYYLSQFLKGCVER